MVLGALGCVNNRCVYYLSEITTRTSNIKNTVLVLIGLQSIPPKNTQFTKSGRENSSRLPCCYP